MPTFYKVSSICKIKYFWFINVVFIDKKNDGPDVKQTIHENISPTDRLFIVIEISILNKKVVYTSKLFPTRFLIVFTGLPVDFTVQYNVKNVKTLHGKKVSDQKKKKVSYPYLLKKSVQKSECHRKKSVRWKKSVQKCKKCPKTKFFEVSKNFYCKKVSKNFSVQKLLIIQKI